MAIATADERYMLTLINAERTSRGLDPLQLEQNLNQSADAHSDWMLRTNTFSHTGVSGTSAGDRMERADFDFAGRSGWAENLAVQSERGAAGIRDDVADLHENLMNSPGHRANILNPNLDYIGIGIDRGTFTYDSGRTHDSVIVTQNFASTQGTVDLDRGAAPTPAPAPTPVSASSTGAITGNNGNNRLNGTSRDDVINGLGGNDALYGGAGNDQINAGAGRDRVYDGMGNDRVNLGSGNDIVSTSAGGRDVFDGGSGIDTISYYGAGRAVAINLSTGGASGAGAGDRILNFENATGSNSGADRLYGSAANNILRGYNGNDNLFGRAGNDRLEGGNGRDRLDGDAGRDQLFGGAGADVFHFDRGDDSDTIRDFQDNIDTIQLDNFGYRNVRDALSDARQIGSDVLFNFGGGDTLRVEDTTLSQLVNDLVLL